jgi:hypothetical protein
MLNKLRWRVGKKKLEFTVLERQLPVRCETPSKTIFVRGTFSIVGIIVEDVEKSWW